MMPFLPFGHRLAGPLLFLLAVGGAIAFTEYWMRNQLRQAPAAPRAPVTASPRRRTRVRSPRRAVA